MDDMHRANDAADRIAAPLRAAERLPSGFEERLLGRIRAESAEAAQRKTERPRSWWMRPRAISRAPIMSFAMAAGFAALVALSTLAATRSRGVASMFAQHKTDTVHVIRFVYHDATAHQISVVGDFNGWGATEFPLISNADGVWTATVALPSGAHEYAFVVDRTQWVADPTALSSRDEFGTPTSRLRVGSVDHVATE
jgi:hypothetical protein